MSPDLIKKQKEDYFNSLVGQPKVKKKRKCISRLAGCAIEFVSDHDGHRVCCFCAEKVDAMGKRAEETFI